MTTTKFVPYFSSCFWVGLRLLKRQAGKKTVDERKILAVGKIMKRKKEK